MVWCSPRAQGDQPCLCGEELSAAQATLSHLRSSLFQQPLNISEPFIKSKKQNHISGGLRRTLIIMRSSILFYLQGNISHQEQLTDPEDVTCWLQALGEQTVEAPIGLCCKTPLRAVKTNPR